jgi:hypothetical protein
MDKSVLLVLVDHRKRSAVKVQKILTAWGCLVKTRLGIHDGVLKHCSDTGLLILELVGEKAKRKELARKLGVLPGVTAKLVELSLK